MTAETNPDYHALLTAFERETGCAVLVNTSFNVRGEPIVMSPQDAYRCFMRTEIDFLVLGGYLLAKGQQPEWSEPPPSAPHPPGPLTTAEGRRFGLSVGGALVGLAGILWWRHHEGIALFLAVSGAVLLLLGAVLPSRLGPVERAWMRFAAALGRVTTPVVLGVMFFLVITPIGALVRLLGKSAVRTAATGPSAWHRREDALGRSDLTRQF